MRLYPIKDEDLLDALDDIRRPDGTIDMSNTSRLVDLCVEQWRRDWLHINDEDLRRAEWRAHMHEVVHDVIHGAPHKDKDALTPEEIEVLREERLGFF